MIIILDQNFLMSKKENVLDEILSTLKIKLREDNYKINLRVVIMHDSFT